MFLCGFFSFDINCGSDGKLNEVIDHLNGLTQSSPGASVAALRCSVLLDQNFTHQANAQIYSTKNTAGTTEVSTTKELSNKRSPNISKQK